MYESHGQDSRYIFLGDVCSTVSQKYGTGGGNVPIVLTYNQTAFGKYVEDDAAVTLRNSGGDCGGGAAKC